MNRRRLYMTGQSTHVSAPQAEPGAAFDEPASGGAIAFERWLSIDSRDRGNWPQTAGWPHETPLTCRRVLENGRAGKV